MSEIRPDRCGRRAPLSHTLPTGRSPSGRQTLWRSIPSSSDVVYPLCLNTTVPLVGALLIGCSLSAATLLRESQPGT